MALAGLVLLVTAVSAAEAPREASGDTLAVVLATWRAEALGRAASGTAGWVNGCDGTIRLDLSADSRPGAEDLSARGDPWQALLSRAGQGWTLVAPAAGEGLYGAWDREWRAPPAGLAALARGVVRWAADGHAPRGGPAFVLAAVDDQAPAEKSSVGTSPRLRPELASRARGGGGRGEVARLAPGRGGAIVVRSSRRPGRLVVTPLERRGTGASPEEAFLPWWSLGEILALPPRTEPGTSPDPAR